MSYGVRIPRRNFFDIGDCIRLLILDGPIGQELLAAVRVSEEANGALGQVVFHIPVHEKVLPKQTGAAAACFASADQKFDVGYVHIGDGKDFGGRDRGNGVAADSSKS